MTIDYLANSPTPFPDVNYIVKILVDNIKFVLGSHVIGMYLEGSLGYGDFDADSDIDFVVVTDEEISEQYFIDLQAMHARIAAIDSPWAIQLEGTYISRAALRRHDPSLVYHPNIERGIGERLKMVDHGEPWNIHRYVLREHGIPLFGPDPKTLIDPVTPGDLRRCMVPLLKGWVTDILTNPETMTSPGYQSYIVLTLCRILYTIQFGQVVSKFKAANWVKENVPDNLKSLIDRAWSGRHSDPQFLPIPDDMNQTRDFIRYVLDLSHSVILLYTSNGG